MKKILLVVAVVGLSMASCKKDYTCECSTTVKTTNNGSTTTTGPVTASANTGKMKKSEAKTKCETNNGTTTQSAGGYTSETTIACSIK